MFILAAILFSANAAGATCSIDWSYDRSAPNGPAHWGSIRDVYDVCRLGAMQNPIDVSGGLSETGSVHLTLASPARVTVIKKPYTVEVQPEPGAKLGTIVSNEGSYEIEQLHFHSPSEHMLRGVEFPAEVHFVARRAGPATGPGLPVNGDYAAFGMMIGLGAPNRMLSTIFNAIPTVAIDPTKTCPSNAVVVEFTIDAAGPVGTYVGSLTTPPCTEGLRWYMSMTPITMSPEQFRLLLAGLPRGGNARPRQLRSGRAIGVRNVQ